ncbi:TPR-like protein [Obba rivulosa]|uniref:TPR-like protein n=1 Tax=Obba rivulosa TaxID=1052685 RepID=A0A8E2AY08_9APHY|nr:TPR-like protein [Obba rivulosa]
MSNVSADPDAPRKIATAKEKKEVADQAFKSGDLKAALRSYYEALLYLKGIDRNTTRAMGGPALDAAAEKPKTEVDEMLEKIHSNMSACHMKNGNWKRTIETADLALAINPKNSKALFRKAKALGEQGYFEKAEKILEDLLKQDDSDAPAINAELTRLRAIDKEREKAHNQKFKGFLNREKKAETESAA